MDMVNSKLQTISYASPSFEVAKLRKITTISAIIIILAGWCLDFSARPRILKCLLPGCLMFRVLSKPFDNNSQANKFLEKVSTSLLVML